MSEQKLSAGQLWQIADILKPVNSYGAREVRSLFLRAAKMANKLESGERSSEAAPKEAAPSSSGEAASRDVEQFTIMGAGGPKTAVYKCGCQVVGVKPMQWIDYHCPTHRREFAHFIPAQPHQPQQEGGGRVVDSKPIGCPVCEDSGEMHDDYQACESCDTVWPVKTMSSDGDGCWFCPPCIQGLQNEPESKGGGAASHQGSHSESPKAAYSPAPASPSQGEDVGALVREWRMRRLGWGFAEPRTLGDRMAAELEALEAEKTQAYAVLDDGSGQTLWTLIQQTKERAETAERALLSGAAGRKG